MAAVADVPLYDPEADVFKNPSKWRRRSCSTLRGTTQASNWDRLGRIGTFERALAEGAPVIPGARPPSHRPLDPNNQGTPRFRATSC
jgi:hypothetical protein